MDDEVVVVEKKSVPRTRMTVAILNSLLKQIAAQHPDTFPHLQKHGKKGRTVLAWVAALKISPLLASIPSSTLESWTEIAVTIAQSVFERAVKAASTKPSSTLDLTVTPSSSSSSSSSSLSSSSSSGDVLTSAIIDKIAAEYAFFDGDACTKVDIDSPRFPINDPLLHPKSASNSDAKLAAAVFLQMKKDVIPLLHCIGKVLEENMDAKEKERKDDRMQQTALREMKEARIAAGGDKPLKKAKYNGPYEGAERPGSVSSSSSSSSSSSRPSDLFDLLAKLVENEGAASTPANNATAAASVTATRTPPPSVWRTGTIMLLKAEFPDNASLGIPGAEAVLDAAFLDMDTLLPYFVGQVEAFSRTEFTKKVSPPLPLILSDRIYAVLANKLALL